MSGTAKSNANKSGEPRKNQATPVAVYFEGDDVARIALGTSPHYKTIPYAEFDDYRTAPEIVIAVSREDLLDENFNQLRLPNLRIIALANARFKSPRLDGAVYMYTTPDLSFELMERMIDNAVDHLNLVLTRHEVYERLILATQEINELNRIGAALSAEHDTQKLMEMILSKCRQITKADAGSLYVVEEEAPKEGSQANGGGGGKKALRFKLAQNDSVEVSFKEMLLPISENSIAGYVALRGEGVNLEDCYELPEGVPYRVNRAFDEDSGYRTKSILALPMRDQKDEIVGVVQLINAKRDRKAKLDSPRAVEDQVIPFTARQQDLVLSLASQAAVAFENNKLYANIQKLFEGFVKASVIAIEARDPTTSGHSFRVASLTTALAEAADRDTKVFRDVHFTRDEMKEIRYASLLHDFGKVGVREEVLVKARKLYPSQLELIKQRFDFVRKALEAQSKDERVQILLRGGVEKYKTEHARLESDVARQIKELDEYMHVIEQSNVPSVMPGGNFEQLTKIAARQYMDMTGSVRPLLTKDEVRLLSIRKGSLDEFEREQIESHVMHTYNFLKQIPWTKEIGNIPQIALGHHEKMNGGGYPHKLAAPKIPLQTRMMTVSDIFDALSASDRPYKKAVNRERALEILHMMVQDGELDGTVFQLFVDARIYEKVRNDPALV
jgi:HD-GYP domain-containing protein (c-di-GMP phosphodiesterase class II)